MGGKCAYIPPTTPREKKREKRRRVTPFVAFFFKARPEVHKAKAQVSTLRRVGA